MFGYYEDINGRNKDGITAAVRSGLLKCFRCEHWESCWWGSCHIPIPKGIVYAERLWGGLLVFASTFEVLARGFTLGFGMRMFHFVFSEDHASIEATKSANSVLRSYRRKILISVVAGLSLAAFLHGSSIFVPAEVREDWFQYDENVQDKATLPTTKLPLALYEHIRSDLIMVHKNTDGTLDCPSANSCDGELCNDDESSASCRINIDFWSYLWNRFGTGLSYMATTFEVLLRGFCLGFGARMLKFMFLSKDILLASDGDSSSDQQQNDSEDEYRVLLESFQHRTMVSMISGLSLAAMVHGSSLFVPTRLRDLWFVEGIHTEDVLDWLVFLAWAATPFVAFFFILTTCCCGSFLRAR